jgi:hypothetical protein
MANKDSQGLWADIHAAIEAQADVLGRFVWRAGQFFDACIEAKGDGPFTRRPNVSLRLVAEGVPAAKVVVAPAWVKDFGRLRRTGGMSFELFVEQAVKVDGADALKKQRRAALRYRPGSDGGYWHIGRVYYSSGREDVARVLSTLRAFVEDPRALLARSHDSCCICGRLLTDGVSMARGIGPECVKFSGQLLFLSGPSLVVAEAN